MTTYTIEVYKRDARRKTGEKRVETHDIECDTLAEAEEFMARLQRTGYRLALHETYVTKQNLMGGGEFTERYDTPHFCSPASESYWSM